MRKILPLSLLVGLTLIGPSVNSASASVMTYNVENTFRADTPSHNPAVESFENTSLQSGQSILASSPLTITSQTPGKTFSVLGDNKNANGTHATDGDNYLAMDNTGASTATDYAVNFHFSSAVSSFGLYVTDFGDEALNGTLSVSITYVGGGTEQFQVAQGSNVDANFQFFGMISNGQKFTDISFIVTNDSQIGFDEVYYDTENVPEPSSLALGAIGMMGLGFWRRKRAAV